jgi:gluconate 5-dehydrogenase
MSFLDNLYNLTGKVAVVTGATGQLGKKITNAFVQTGCIAIGLDVKVNDANKVAGAIYYEMDIVNKQAVMDIFEKIINTYGSLDILVNNAGVSTFAPFEEREEKDLDWVMDVNVKGTFFCIQSFVNFFDENKFKRGSIVNIGSFYGVVSPDFRIYGDTPRRSPEIYGATKAGVIQMTKYFGVHLADRNIRVNAVSPGGIYNPASPQGPEFLKHYSFRCQAMRLHTPPGRT